MGAAGGLGGAAFCTDCGGHLYSRAPEGFERVAVRLGAVQTGTR